MSEGSPVESLLSFAEELERRDADVAQALTGVESLQTEVEELRAHAAAVAAFLDVLPAALAERAADERDATETHGRAEHAVRTAEQLVERAGKEEQRLEAERALQQARADLHAAEFWVAQAREARAELERDGAVRRVEGETLAQRSVELAPLVRDVPAGLPNLDGALDWASRARGALLLQRSALARERDEVVREATELLASVSGDPLTATGAAGVRDRLARALGAPSS
jgi:DNA repair exonuclease SbcCD ATPase subunit